MGNFIQTELNDCFIYEPKVFSDNRGYFLETHNLQEWFKHKLNINFIQDNESYSRSGTLRGLHFQSGSMSQAKLVRVVVGEVLDVVVDLRKNSSTYKRHVKVSLSGENKRQLFVPRGFAHGFLVKSEYAIFSYKCDNFYSPEHDAGILFNDQELGIDWELDPSKLIISEKDTQLPLLKDIEPPF